MSKNEIKKRDNGDVELVFKYTALSESINFDNYEKLPVSLIGEMGALSTPVVESIMAISQAGGSGLYMVNTAGGTLFECASKGAYIGGMTTASGEIGQAALTPVAFNPATLGTTIVMMSAMIKLNEISENTIKIINKLERKDKADLKSSFKALIRIFDDYRLSSNKQEYMKQQIQSIDNIMLKVDSIHEDYKEALESMSKDKKIELTATKYIAEVKKYYNIYQMSLYVLAMATYLKTIFSNEFGSDYINSKISEMNDMSIEQKELYTKCYDAIEKKYGNTVTEKLKAGGEFILNGISEAPFIPSSVLGMVGETVAKVFSKVGKEKLIEAKKKGKEKALDTLKQIDYSAVVEFENKMETINKLYNEPFSMIVDKDYVYIEK